MYQSSFMGHAMMNVLTALLLCLAAANAVPAHFPHGKTVVYKYYADVKAGIIEPAPFASQFALEGLLHVRHDISDPTLKNAYCVTLTDAKFGLYNGHVLHHERIDTIHPVVESAKMIQDPFLVVYDENGKFQGVKLVENESGWSKNIKQAIASMLQLDLSHIYTQTPIKTQSFITNENTIHGTCQVAYNVHPIDRVHPESTNVFVVTKMHDPKTCTHFVQRVFDHVDASQCHVEQEDGMTTASRRVFEIEDQGNEILIKKLVGHGVINYFPWQARSEAHYLLTNQTLTLQRVDPVTEQVPLVNFQNVPIIRDVSFNKPQGNYALHAAEDVTHGRHIVKLDVLIPKLKKMLGEASDYLEENHMEMKQPDWKHGQTINRLLQTMSYMDLGSLEQVYNVIQDTKTERDETIKNVFLGMVPNIGTTASCLFVRNVIRKHKVTDLTATLMLHKLPMHVKIPSERLLLEMEDLLKFSDTISLEVRKASILCFATLVHKTFKHQPIGTINPLLDRYLQHFHDHVINEPTYQMKMVYMLAMKNVGCGNMHKLLEPIIRGDVVVSEKPTALRVQAIWAVQDVVIKDVQYVHNLLWPILSNTNLPLPLRIAAYHVLMEQQPNMTRMMNMYWFMVYEKDEHLYNYHVTTIKGLANSVDPCMTPVREIARKILRFTRMRHIPGPLTARYHYDYVDPKYGHGETFKTSLVLDKLTGFPSVGSVEHQTTIARKPVNQMAIYWSVTSMDAIVGNLKDEFVQKRQPVTNDNVKKVLERAAQDMPHLRDIHVDIIVTMNEHVVTVHHYNELEFNRLIKDAERLKKIMNGEKDALTFNWQQVMYENLYELHVPTDMGLPAVLATRIPNVMSFKSNSYFADTKPMNLKLDVDIRTWRHGEYVMSIYNPIVDVWHAVRRVTSRDVVFPIEMNIGYNHETKSLKVALPRLPVSKLSVTGMSTRAKNYVTVTEDETDVLKKTCATCHHHEVVSEPTVQKKVYQNTVDLKDTGLQYYTSIFDCETNVTPIDRMNELMRVFSSEHKNTMGSKVMQMVMGLRQQMTNDMITPEVGGCGNLLKIEPSILHPTSHVDMNFRMNVEDLDHLHDKLHVLSSEKINVRGTVDAKAASTNASIRSWDLNVNFDMSQGHVNDNLKVVMTRVTPGEKNFRICVDGQKNYPVIDVDPLKLGVAKEETNAKLTITAGQTDEDKCVRDDMLITMTFKGEMTEEQKKHMAYDNVHGACIKDVQNLLLQTQEGHIPKTWQCIHETILHTTLRKYTTNVAYKKVPQNIVSTVVMFEDMVRAGFLPHVRYLNTHTETGTAKIIVEYPESTPHLDVTVVNPVCGYELRQLPIGDPVWYFMMGNTRFSTPSMYKYMNDETKICTVYPQVLLTLDNGTIPFVLSDQWTLLSGTHIQHTYAVFAKVVQGTKVAMKVFIGEHSLEVVPTDAKPVITLNGNVVDHYEKGVMVPADEPDTYAIKMTKSNEHIVLQSEWVPLTILCTPNSVTLAVDDSLQGQITGMCGHMDSTHKEKIPKIYSASHL